MHPLKLLLVCSLPNDPRHIETSSPHVHKARARVPRRVRPVPCTPPAENLPTYARVCAGLSMSMPRGKFELSLYGATSKVLIPRGTATTGTGTRSCTHARAVATRPCFLSSVNAMLTRFSCAGSSGAQAPAELRATSASQTFRVEVKTEGNLVSSAQNSKPLVFLFFRKGIVVRGRYCTAKEV